MIGCTDGSCIYRDNSKIMHTNSGCSCEKVILRTFNIDIAIQVINHLKKLRDEKLLQEDILQFNKQYSWLSNFSPCSIELDSIIYKSVEHAYMSAKSDDEQWKYFCAKEDLARIVKNKSKSIILKDNWNSIKVDIMYNCLLQKYTQEPYKSLLKNTGDCFIQEGNTWKDTFWGVDLSTSNGKNMLGTLIMNIRDKL